MGHSLIWPRPLFHQFHEVRYKFMIGGLKRVCSDSYKGSKDFLPFDVFFCNVAPAVSAYGEAPVSVIDVDLDIHVFAFAVPRIFAVFSQFTSWAFHIGSKSSDGWMYI
jgi:hypothetical protein